MLKDRSIQRILLEASELEKTIEHELIVAQGEITPKIEELLNFKAMKEVEIREKADLFAFTIERLDNLLEHYTQQINDFNKVLDGIGKTSEMLYNAIERLMIDNDIDAIEGVTKTLKLRLNPPSVEILKPEAIPAQFERIKVDVEPDRKKIKEFLTAGNECDWARLRQNKSLRIETGKKKNTYINGRKSENE